MNFPHKHNFRKSRIAIPTQRRTTQTALPSSLVKRAQSVDRHSTKAHSMLPLLSTAKKTRSHSQTPSRSIFQTPSTPGNRTPLSNSYLQSADKRGPVEDKLFIHHEATKITNYAIRHNVTGFVKDTKLKNVTYKQFTGLVSFMLEKLVGNRYPLQGIDEIMKALHILDYPYTINKSWMKTPTAGHAFNHVVLMLGWLLNLVEPPLMPEGETELGDFESIENLVHDTDFPTLLFQKVFMEKAKDGFQMWNLREDEQFEKLNEELADMYVAQSTNRAVKSIKRLDDDIIALEKEQKQLVSKAKPSSNHQQYMQLEKEVKDMKRVLDGKHEMVNQFMQSIETERKTYESEQRILKQREADINKLKSKIRAQVMSKQEMKQLIEENYLLRETLTAKQKSIENLLEENVKDPVEASHLVRQKVQKVNELNENMYMLAKNFEPSIPNFDPAEYELDANSPNIQLEIANLKPNFKVMKKWLTNACETYKASHINVQTQIEQISCEFEENQKKLKQAAEKVALELQALNKTLSDLDNKFAEVDGKYIKEKEEQEKFKKQIAQTKAEIEAEKIAKTKISEETQLIMKRFLEEQQKILEDLKEESRKLDEKLEYYERVRDEAKAEAIKKQKELLESLKRLGYPK